MMDKTSDKRISVSCLQILTLAISLSLLSACAKLQQPLTPIASEKSGQSSAIYPHPENFGSGHLTYLTKNGPVSKATQTQCSMCHADRAGQGGVKQAKALNISCGMSCHGKDAVGSSGKPVAPVRTSCADCHDDVGDVKSAASHHFPATTGLCTTCHEVPAAHLEDEGAPVVTQGRCDSCHEVVKKQPVVHAALEMGCTSCHNPHDGAQPKLLKDKSPDLCLTCHSDLTNNAKSIHGIIHRDGSCLNCHAPHASAQPKLLKDPSMAMCTSCHSQEIKSSDRVIPNIEAKVKNGLTSHWKATDGSVSCGDCHESHASRFPRLLKENFSLGPYVEFFPGNDLKPGTYALCFQCHDQEMVSASGDTNFRKDVQGSDGVTTSKNLHQIHVVNSGGTATSGPSAGRSCFLCHDVHGAPQAHMIRGTIGAFSMKLVFTDTGNGGTCATACHGGKPRSYERLR